ncbi:MAG TPA: YfhO family protein [Verrucomicrobiae bacterium]|nr:YfhO family protein [Verrucomicrobiae bacterium]
MQTPTSSPDAAATEKNARAIAEAAFSPVRFALFLIAIVIAKFPRVVLGQETFFHRDYGLFTYPIAHYVRECFWRGEIPLWNPFNNFGIPLLAQWNTSVLYPPTLFFLILPLPWSLAVFNLGHLVFAGLGMYFLARRWTGSQIAASFAGTVFAFNGLSLHMLMWISNLACWAWMPWVILFVEQAWNWNADESLKSGDNVSRNFIHPLSSILYSRFPFLHPCSARRAVLLAAVAGAMQMLAGAPELILLTWLFLAAMWLGRMLRENVSRKRLFWRTTAICALVAGFSAAQLLPFMQLLAHSPRDTGFGDSKWAMPGWGWANFFVPLFHCSPSILGIYSQDEQQWTSSYYMGIGALALAALALGRKNHSRARWLAVAAVIGVVLSMGNNTPVYACIRRVFPFIGMMRYPIKIEVLTTFALPLLAAYGLNANKDEAGPHKQKLARPFFTVGIIFAIVIAGILVYANKFPAPKESWAVTLASGLSRALFLALILAGAWMVLRAHSVRTVTLAAAMILLLVTVDAFTHTADQNPTLPNVIYGPLGNPQLAPVRLGESRAAVNPKLNAFLSFAATPNAFNYYLGERSALFLDCNLIDRIPTVSGFFSVDLKSSAEVSAIWNDPSLTFPKPLEDFLAISRISSEDSSFTWTNRSNFMPFVTGGQKPVFAGDAETLRALASTAFTPSTIVYLPTESRGSINAGQGAVAIQMKKFEAEQVDFETQSTGPAMIVIAQAFYEPWHAYVDGKRVPLWKANGAFQSLQVPAGKHEVRVVYQDRAFRTGTAISIATLLLTGLCWVRTSRREKG